mmetsp:Transcript_20417/g.34398  ORF Transcript_20417/g.34398 Transcript_20417/m.34398 type:complete len:410 (+) Transcript_20417:201-1430(+)
MSKPEVSEDWGELSTVKSNIFVKDFANAHELNLINDMKVIIGIDVLQKPPLCDQQENIDDNKFLRFLRGYEGDPIKAAAAYKEYLTYRADNNINDKRVLILQHDHAYPNTWPEYNSLWAVTAKGLRECYGRDKFGNLVTVTEIGELDVRGIISENLVELYLDYNQTLEEWFNLELHRLSKQAGQLVGRQDIINVSNLGVFQFNIACYKVLEKCLICGTYYPEASVCITSVGNGWLAMQAWNNIIRPFIPERTKMKIRAVGTEFLPVLLETIDLDQLPLLWGDTRNDTPFNKLFSSDCDDEGDPSAPVNVTICRRDVKIVRIQVLNSHSTITCHWTLLSHTIDFEAYFLPSQNELERVQIAERAVVSAEHKVTEHECSVSAGVPGTLVLVFDNSTSILRSKTVRYRCCLT